MLCKNDLSFLNFHQSPVFYFSSTEVKSSLYFWILTYLGGSSGKGFISKSLNVETSLVKSLYKK